VHEDGTIADIPGGIDAWIARATGVNMQRTGGDSTTDSSSSPVQSRGRQLRNAEKEVSRLERRRSSITTKLLSSVDHEEQARLGIELETVQKALNSAEDLWLALVD
jgi:hypothetical protein